MNRFFEDVTLGEILGAIIAVFTFLNLLFSGRAFLVLRRAKVAIEHVADRIGHPNPRHASLSGGRDLYEKLESLEDVIRPIVDRDLVTRLREETAGPGRRRAEGEDVG